MLHVVLPSLPEDVMVDQISSKTARVHWRLTHRTPDQRADQLILRVTFANQSLADEIRLPGSANSTSLSHLVPDNRYLVVLTALNRDGEVTTNPESFRTLVGPPALSGLEIERVNRTGFIVSIQLMYTGGGAITKMNVSYRPTSDPSAATTRISLQPDNNGLRVTATFDLADAGQDEIVAGELQFTVMVYNAFNFVSPPHTHEGM